MKRITMNLDLFNAVIGYLGKRPFAEVAPLIEELQKDARLIDEAEPSKSTDSNLDKHTTVQ